MAHVGRRPPHRDFPLHQVTTKRKRITLSTCTVPSSAHTRKPSALHRADHHRGRKHRNAHARTAYYLYEVLYIGDHQHRVSVFPNPHCVWKGRLMQLRDYIVGLMGVLIWVIVGTLGRKNRWGNNTSTFWMKLNVKYIQLSSFILELNQIRS